MEPPARPIRTELREATIAAIRQRGPEAVGLLLIGLVRLLLATAVLVVLHFAGANMFGFSLMSIPFAAASVLSLALSFLATQGHEWGGDSEVTTQDEYRPLLAEQLQEPSAYARLKKVFIRTEPGYFQERSDRAGEQESPKHPSGASSRGARNRNFWLR